MGRRGLNRLRRYFGQRQKVKATVNGGGKYTIGSIKVKFLSSIHVQSMKLLSLKLMQRWYWFILYGLEEIILKVQNVDELYIEAIRLAGSSSLTQLSKSVSGNVDLDHSGSREIKEITESA